MVRRVPLVLLCVVVTLPLSALNWPQYGMQTAISFAEAYLNARDDAVWDLVALDSPLRALGKEKALAEIAVRAGTREGASWKLLMLAPRLTNRVAAYQITWPSGADDIVFLEFTGDATNGLHLQSIRTTAEELPESWKPPSGGGWGPGLGVVAIILVNRRRRNTRLGIAALGVATIVLLAIGYLPRLTRRTGITTASAPGAVAELRKLMPLRDALCRGLPLPSAASLGELDPAQRAAAKLWRAEAEALLPHDGAAVPQMLPAGVPATPILLARTAAALGDVARAKTEYAKATAILPGNDGLNLEAASTLFALGAEKEARAYVERITAMETADAEAYYLLAALDLSAGKRNEAGNNVLHGWSLRPLSRSDVLLSPLTAPFLTPSFRENLQLGSFDEPVVVPEGRKRWRGGAPLPNAVTLGRLLRITARNSEILAPGGIEIADADVPAVDAATFEQQDDERGLRDYGRTLSSGWRGAMLQPAAARRLRQTISRFAARSYWSMIITLTDGLPVSRTTPLDLIASRAEALLRDGRREQAKSLLQSVAALDRLSLIDRPAMLKVGELMSEVDLWDDASNFVNESAVGNPQFRSRRLAQIRLDERLANSRRTSPTAHFDIRYTAEVSPQTVAKVGEVLESELPRLSYHVPAANLPRIAVHILPWSDFKGTYTGSDEILGFYVNGKLTVPVSSTPEFAPEVVAVYAHELTHALIATATSDRAPRWFHEGLARRLEGKEYAVNPFKLYPQDVVALPLLDAALASPHPEVASKAYDEAETVIRYIEHRGGWVMVQKFLTEFQRGEGTETIVTALFGQPFSEFDRDFRSWGASLPNQIFPDNIPHRYDNSIDIHFSRGPR